MSLATEDHLDLLISCIKRSSDGKIDFSAVATDCNIISAGAAAKRYSRLLKSHGENKARGAGSGSNSTNTAQANNQGQASPSALLSSPPKTPRKRKAAAPMKSDGNTNDDGDTYENGGGAAPPNKKARTPRGKGKDKASVDVKQEQEEGDLDDTSVCMKQEVCDEDILPSNSEGPMDATGDANANEKAEEEYC
ncbi:hypothetical protein BDV18DRAFT_163735 [Aspergillus unguis]